jgi:hypothetical protein
MRINKILSILAASTVAFAGITAEAQRPGRSLGGSNGGFANAGGQKKIGGGGGFKTLPPAVKTPIKALPPKINNPGLVKPPVIKPPVIKPPIKPLPPIVKPPVKLPPGIKLPPIVKPPVKLPPGIKLPPIHPIPPKFPPIKPPIVVLPPIHCPPVFCPPIHFWNCGYWKLVCYDVWVAGCGCDTVVWVDAVYDECGRLVSEGYYKTVVDHGHYVKKYKLAWVKTLHV